MSELVINKQDHILHIALNRPDVRNALNKNLLLTLAKELALADSDSSIRVVVFSGAGEKAFSAGADLKERSLMSEAQAFEFVKLIQTTFQKIATMSQPTIAALNGDAFGGGLELALACDIRIGAEDLKLGLTECSLGIVPGAGGTQRLPQIIGISRAMEMIFSAKRIDGIEASRCGLLNELTVSRGLVLERALSLADTIAKNAPLAVRAAKKAILVQQQNLLSAGLAAEIDCYQEILKSKDRLEGLKAFQEKRAPCFSGL
jgi:methylglutaconyl-CoA hydratase